MNDTIKIVDLFSGPGGLGEGFSAYGRKTPIISPYKISISIEKDEAAHRTLRLRAFLRHFQQFPPEYYAWLEGKVKEPNWSELYPVQWNATEREVVCAELGRPETTAKLSTAIAHIKRTSRDRTLLIGGPPCQAYSLVGRARNAGIKSYVASDDQRHFLYKEYCRVLNELSPAVFVMENVKGILSSTVEGRAIFEQVVSDLERAGVGYRLFGLADNGADSHNPRRFLIKAEEFGVPQARHRVIICGIRADIVERLPSELRPTLKRHNRSVTVDDAIGSMSPLRTGLSKNDNPAALRRAIEDAVVLLRSIVGSYIGKNPEAYINLISDMASHVESIANLPRQSCIRNSLSDNLPIPLKHFLDDERLNAIPNHDTRGHMPSDLARYMYAACFAIAEGVSPKASQFPREIAPAHSNWDSGNFADRFRVQRQDFPSTTITSHIAKDGHYFIHPDVRQCRSLTVREAARLQTFPDNYRFMGNRTEQFIQVGNAVPPYLALQIAEAILPVFDHV
ncbi:DNA cytosine methyltransferase [Agrobacterium tumefaciens]|uniref:DNA cytosine methyltransferase n=1 Tax=Agrobacterium tumefaciens TaxID=358 RepID=UPI00045B803B|nr:DNA cytosine methyltransferase [Agrobacterium tumefaciens]CDN95975.1 Cytosine-specific methyltransferase [Agrobacterium tumefaciens]